MIHYHGGPITPDTCALKAWKGRHAFISFANPGQLAWPAKSPSLSRWITAHLVSGRKNALLTGMTTTRLWPLMNHPRFAFAVIPDVIGGTSEENDALIAEWPHGKVVGAPVWHERAR
jgi:hypothetical protein